MLLSSKDILLLRLDVNLVKQTDLLQTGKYDKLPTFTTYQKIVLVEIVVVNSFLMGFFHVTASVPITQASLYTWWQLNCYQFGHRNGINKAQCLLWRSNVLMENEKSNFKSIIKYDSCCIQDI